MKRKHSLSRICIFYLGLFFCPLISYPFPEHLNGKDSFVMASITQSIINDGYCSYLIHFLSYVGLYPKSYPAGPQTFLAALSILTGLNIDYSTMYFCIYIFLITYSSTFALGHKTTGSTLGAFFTAVLYITARTTTSFLGNWNFSTRVLILTFSPVIFLLFIKYFKDKDIRFLYLGFLSLLFSLTFHRTSYFIAFFILTFIFAWIYRKLLTRETIESIRSNYNILIRSFVTFSLIFLFLSPILLGRYFYLHGDVVVENPSFKIIPGESFISIFINLIANYALGFGFFTFFAVFGYASISKDFITKPISTILFLNIILAGFIWVELTYARTFLMLLLSVICAIGILHVIELLSPYCSKQKLQIFFVVLLLFSQILPFFLVVNDETVDYEYDIYNEDEYMEILSLGHTSPDDTLDASNYLRLYISDHALFSNYNHPESQVRAYAGLPPLGNFYRVKDYESYSPNWNQSNIIKIILGQKVDLGIIDGPSYEPLRYSVFYNQAPKSDEYYSKALQYNVGGSGDYFVLLVVSSNDRLVWEPNPSEFLIEMQYENYKIYENKKLSYTYFSTN